MYSCGTLTSRVSNIHPCSCFAREPWHTAIELSPLCFPMLHLVCVRAERHDPPQLWHINFSSFQYSTLFVFCKRALTYRYGILTSLLSLLSYDLQLYSSLNLVRVLPESLDAMEHSLLCFEC